MELTDLDAELAVNQLKELADNIHAAISVLSQKLEGATTAMPDLLALAPYLRMSFSWIVLSLYKVDELWRVFGRFASDDLTIRMRAIIREINSREISDFRDQVVAHLLSRETKKPMGPEELFQAALAVMKNDPPEFFHWLHDIDGLDQTTVSATLMQFRDAILARYPAARIYS